MNCPFLKETEVKFCGSSSVGKMIVKSPLTSGDEKCSSSTYSGCEVYKALGKQGGFQSHCPQIREALVQYCAAAPIVKYIPYTESGLSRCGSDNHRYCDLFIATANPNKRPPATTEAARKNGEPISMLLEMQEEKNHVVDGVQVPAGLFYSNNHMWLDVTREGSCHIGIDGFLAKILGHVERVTFVKGAELPTAVLRVRNVGIHVVFPNFVHLSGYNMYLRAAEKLTADPYGSGWLFEGMTPPNGRSSPAVCAGLMHGERALGWMEDEVERISRFVHETLARTHPGCDDRAMDGGVFSGDLVQHLSHDELLDLLNEFFLPHASWITE
jgi:glycine cleavage system H lipoate-binding protein